MIRTSPFIALALFFLKGLFLSRIHASTFSALGFVIVDSPMAFVD